MPRPNPNITVDSRVSVSVHYLRNTTFASATLNVDLNAPRLRFNGTITELYTENGADYCKVTFDDAPDMVIALKKTCLRYEGARPSRRRQTEPIPERAVFEEQPDLLDDAIQTPSDVESDEDEDEILDLNWEARGVTVDQRLAHPDSSYRFTNPSLIGLAGAHATPCQFFLHFLPCDHIQEVVIPAINTFARQTDATWIDINWMEYLTWIMLFLIQSIIHCTDKKMYWRKSSSPYQLNIDFTDYMDMKRFDDITQMHVFVVPDGETAKVDPLYQVRSFLAGLNSHLETTMQPGKYMCVDESMNQWLGKGMPNLKKVPRKPHPIGQEYKTIADNITSIIMRLDFCGDPTLQRPRPNEDRSIIATVKRLTRPWFFSGRTIIADSWFGSPEMARKLLDVGLHSIMQVCKRKYWPRGMPANDILEALGMEYGSKMIMKSTQPGEHLYVAAFRDLKAKALVATCSTTTDGNIRRFKDPNATTQRYVEVVRPHVFDDYESNKSSVDTANNRRDNQTNFHDVMRTYRWELRCLSFFLGVTEANAFSAFKHFSLGGKDVNHGEFRWRLAESLKAYIRELQEIPAHRIVRTRGRYLTHSLVGTGKNEAGNYVRRQCGMCGRKTQKRCSCNTMHICNGCFGSHVLAANNL